MSISEETLKLMTAAVKKDPNSPGTLIRSKLTNQLLWKSNETDENDPVRDILTIIDAASPLNVAPTRKGRRVFGEISTNCQPTNGNSMHGEKVPVEVSMEQHDIENWQDQWDILKNAGLFCSYCKYSKKGREIYLSHNLKGPDGEITCPYLGECVCTCEQAK